ncbi:hypothetical protein [Streptomonospora wellingtoniae]|uniref:Uncharacterized protein n=1 Tax=Streptomonospora wellingtoniae TaxID=3075544 RepID=A0ABU2KUC1_9ACTN|nr:hypothetical protein [Streptomonospora sp. DSM 45055]MDT0302897.1 hypothetical protein [Streptomonospora sp. DSM 45055]
MLAFFRGDLACDALLDYIDHLPSDSAFHAAIAEDEEYAEMVLAEYGDTPPGPPRLTEFGPEVRALATVVDKLSHLISIQIARAGKSPPRMDNYPRPVTALEKVRRRRRFEAHENLTARLLRGRGANARG